MDETTLQHPLTDAECQALRALPLPFYDMLRAAFDMGQKYSARQQHPLHTALLAQHEAMDKRVARLERELMVALSAAEHEAKHADHWKANHDNLVKRCAVLSQRPDLPVDRLPAYAELVRLQEMFALCDAGPWRYMAEPDAPEFVHRYFLESASGHDVRLYINGNFGDDDERRLYGEALAAQLNASVMC